MLDRLMRRTVFADADRIVREDEDRGNLHDRGEPHRRAAVVAEDEERGAVAPQAAEDHAVDRGGHAVLADAEVEVAAAGVVGREVAAGFVEREQRLGRGREVGRAAEQPGNVLGERR